MTKLTEADQALAAALENASQRRTPVGAGDGKTYIPGPINWYLAAQSARRLVTAELAAKAVPDEAAMVEAMARKMCAVNGTSQCAAICLSRFASDNREGTCPDALRVHKRNAQGAFDAIAPHLAALQARAEKARSSALEEAALSAEREIISNFSDQFAVDAQKLQSRRIAAGIRALKGAAQ